MIAFLAATPLQLFNSVSITYDLREKADIYVMDFAVKNIMEVAEKIKKIEFVNDVILLPSYYSTPGKFGIIKDYLFTDNNTFKGKVYSDLFVTYIGDRASIIYDSLLRANPNLKVHFYEEGIGVYYQDKIMYPESWKKSLFYKMIHIKSINPCIDRLSVYEPQLLKPTLHIQTELIKKISGEKEQFFKENFDIRIKDNPYKNYKFIFFDQWLYYNETDKRYTIFKDFSKTDLVKRIFKNSEDVIIKMHPVCHANDYKDCTFRIEKPDGNIWEALLLDLAEIVNSQVYITISSTAVFSPKIIFDYEPTVILIGKAIKNECLKSDDSTVRSWADYIWSDTVEELAERLKLTYTNKSKVLIPQTMEEAIGMISELELQ